MIFTATAIIAAQMIAPAPFKPVEDRGEMLAPEWPWRNRNYSLDCDVSDRTLRRERFSLTLTDDDGLTRARITGDEQHGLNTNGFVVTVVSVSPEYRAKPGDVRYLQIDGPDDTVVQVKQGFANNVLQSTSFTVSYTSKSSGIPDTQQVLGFCVSTSKAKEVDQ